MSYSTGDYYLDLYESDAPVATGVQATPKTAEPEKIPFFSWNNVPPGTDTLPEWFAWGVDTVKDGISDMYDRFDESAGGMLPGGTPPPLFLDLNRILTIFVVMRSIR